MGTTLKVSIFLNCSLLGCVAFLLLGSPRARHQAEVPAKDNSLPPVPEAVTPTPGTSLTAEAKPFHWSQIESSDYRVYMTNLRAIGCPEQTIRDIITADVDSLYAARRQPLESKLAASPVVGRLAAEAELRGLRNEEAAAVTALLVASPAAAKTTPVLTAEIPPSGSVRQEPPDTVLTSQSIQDIAVPNREFGRAALDLSPGSLPFRSVRQEPPATISLPLVFQQVDPSVLTLNPQQTQVVNDLRQKFIDEVSGPNQDPNDPAYAQRWHESQPEVDVDLWTMLGINAYQAHQIAAWAKAHEQTPPAP